MRIKLDRLNFGRHFNHHKGTCKWTIVRLYAHHTLPRGKRAEELPGNLRLASEVVRQGISQFGMSRPRAGGKTLYL